MVLALKEYTKVMVTDLLTGASLREDWRLICLVLLFGLGILLRLEGWSFETSSSVATGTFALVVLACIPLKPSMRVWLYAFAAIILGTASAQYKLESIPTQSIDRETFVQISGVVKSIEYRQGRSTRLTLVVNEIDKETWLIGQNIRLIVRTEVPKSLDAGWLVSLSAVLRQPPGAIVPDGFDFTKYNQFKGIATQGFATSALIVEEKPNHYSQLGNYIENTRSRLSSKILARIDQPLGGIAVALITGQRQYIEPKTANVIRDAGLAHLLAISGLHMGLITGAAFFVFELLFASISGIALRIMPRKAAAIIAWAFALIYLGLSGAGTSTVRAFVMVTVAILAIMTDRRVFSLRSVAIAAFLILLINPDALFESGFQMSFAATIGIVVAYDYLALRRENNPHQSEKSDRNSFFKITLMYILGAAGTSFIAQVTVGPIGLYHFQTFSTVGIIANVVAIPLMAFLVMPAAFLAISFSIAGLELPFLTLMEYGLSVILELATALAAIPMSVISVTPYGVSLLVATTAALIMLMLWRNTLVLIIAIASVFLALMLDATKPADVLIDGAGNIIAMNGTDGLPVIIGGRRDGFRDDAWKRYWGHRQTASFSRLQRACASRGCQTEVKFKSQGSEDKQTLLVVSNSLETTRKACSSGHIVIASYTHKRYCRGATIFLSKQDIARYGPVGLWAENKDKSGRGVRYEWSNPPK